MHVPGDVRSNTSKTVGDAYDVVGVFKFVTNVSDLTSLKFTTLLSGTEMISSS